MNDDGIDVSTLDSSHAGILQAAARIVCRHCAGKTPGRSCEATIAPSGAGWVHRATGAPKGSPGHPCAAGRLREVLEVLHVGGSFRVNDAHGNLCAAAQVAKAVAALPVIDRENAVDPFLSLSVRLDRVGHEIDSIRLELSDAARRQS